MNYSTQGINKNKLKGPKFYTLRLMYMSALVLAILEGCQSALLTNIYGKKLSELTDINNRYLIIPTGSLATTTNNNNNRNNATIASSKGSLNESLSDEPQNDRSPKTPAPHWRPSLISAGQAQMLAPRSRAAAASLGLQQQQQQLPIKSAKSQAESALLAQAQNEPHFLESVSTEFPNPNINNLGHEITKILVKFFKHGYDKRVRPNYSGPPVLVNVSFHIIGISSVDEVQMDFTTDFYFRQKWFDPRLVFEPAEFGNNKVDELCVGAEFAEKIWLPDTFFANEKTATFHKATTENTFIRIMSTGGVYRSIRLTVTCSCPMDLQYFPMDRQRCKIEIESYGYNTKDINYQWEKGDNSVTMNEKIELPQFKILGYRMDKNVQNISSGEYIRLFCEIHFVRSMGYYLIQIYIPASLIVMISWVSFWLHRNATPARVALGVTTVLTMTTLMSSTNAALPKVSYIKSIDVFLGTCFVMVFASLLEYASVGYIGKRIAMKRKRLQHLKQMQQHHQKVCIAAAASAAAAAAATATTKDQHQQQQFVFNENFLGFQQPKQPYSQTQMQSQTLNRHSQSCQTRPNSDSGSKTLQRTKSTTTPTLDPYAQRSSSSVKMTLDRSHADSQANNQLGPESAQTKRTRTTETNNGSVDIDSKAPLLPVAPIQLPLTTTTTSEFEVTPAHDMIKVCGLTPSAIDKHSRVVFPICFICFNLMYWLIYGHISQQKEDKGAPLKPFFEG